MCHGVVSILCLVEWCEFCTKKFDTLMPEFTYPQKKKKDKSIGGFLVKAIEQFL